VFGRVLNPWPPGLLQTLGSLLITPISVDPLASRPRPPAPNQSCGGSVCPACSVTGWSPWSGCLASGLQLRTRTVASAFVSGALCPGGPRGEAAVLPV